jgi:hypothetical protein
MRRKPCPDYDVTGTQIGHHPMKIFQKRYRPPIGINKMMQTIVPRTDLDTNVSTKATSSAPANRGSATTSSSDRYQIINSAALWQDTKPWSNYVRLNWLLGLAYLAEILWRIAEAAGCIAKWLTLYIQNEMRSRRWL